MPHFTRQDYDLATMRLTAQLEHAQAQLNAYEAAPHDPQTPAATDAWNEGYDQLYDAVRECQAQQIALDDLVDTRHGTATDWATQALMQKNID